METASSKILNRIGIMDVYWVRVYEITDSDEDVRRRAGSYWLLAAVESEQLRVTDRLSDGQTDVHELRRRA